jgi:hypothetical protein
MNTNQRITAISLLLIGLFICGCKPSIPTPIPTDIPTETPTESPTPTLAPTDWNGIPIMPGITSGGEYMDDYQFTTSASKEEIIAYYEQEMPRLGWALDPTMMSSGASDLVFNKENVYVFFLITLEGNNNVVDIHPVQQE